eukprot:jgi/Chlat1/5213/Chrsp33S05182
MDAFYVVAFGFLLLVCVGLELGKHSSASSTTSSAEKKGPVNHAFAVFRNNYLAVYSLMMAGDWLQGPYVYALYEHYGYGRGDIGRLFIAGFGSSMIFGTLVGSLADRYGRRRACIMYCVVYSLSCVTKHFSQFRVLLAGRVLGGIATSLLFSAFESWLVAEHFKRNFDGQWLSTTFSSAIFLGNGLTAILAGLLANFLVSRGLGPVIPFDAAIVCLLLGMVIIAATWTENYGDPSESTPLYTTFTRAIKTVCSDQKIAMLGSIQGLFEGSMYTFVFLWTPALSADNISIPHGMVFATFMLSCMVGSSLASRLMARYTPEKYMQSVFVISSAALLVPIVIKRVPGLDPVFASHAQLVGFLCFEACVGVFWPSIMRMRASYVPEESRATILNLFRIPLNLFVCIVLYNVSKFKLSSMFAMCAAFLFLAAVCQRRLAALAEKTKFIASPRKNNVLGHILA